jgi:Fe-S cluster assembly ATP-binding protein
MLQIKNLHVSINETEIIKGLNLNVNPGEVHAIMGPNGTGKSTLAAVIAGKAGYDITEGEITYLEQKPARHVDRRAVAGRYFSRIPIPC